MTTGSHKPNATVTFVCSGAADVGELTDRAARALRSEGVAAMSCLASIGARDEDIMANAMFAGRVLLMDGCPKACTKRAFELAGLKRYAHFDLSEVGLPKGKSPVTEENIRRVMRHAQEVLENLPSKPNPASASNKG